MSVEAFLDTSVLVYAVTSAPEEETKRAMSEKLIENLEFGVSGQVLEEFYDTVTRRIAEPISHDAAAAWLEDLAQLECAPHDEALIFAGTQLSQRYETSYWNGSILAAAERIGAKTLYTEALPHQSTYGSVTAINPFLDL